MQTPSRSLPKHGLSSRLLAPLCCLLVTTTALRAQVPADVNPAQTIRIESQPFQFYELQQASGSPTNSAWTSVGSWQVGDGTPHEWVIPSTGAAASTYQVTGTPIHNLNAELTTLVQQHGVPAIAALVWHNGKVRAMGAIGTRRAGVEAPVTPWDKWHNGSVTKGMTATLAAVMVEQGLISWQTTLGEVFPEKAPLMAEGWSSVTLRQLLSNTSGAPGVLGNELWTNLWNFEGLPRDARRYLIDILTPTPLAFAPGTGYTYSNAGFSIAGAMLEQVADLDWESLMQQKLFGPLGMDHAAFGVTATPRMLDQPYGHGGTLSQMTVVEPARNADNPPAIGPSATSHSTLLDMARYLELHLRGARDEGGLLLQPSSFDTLHTLVDANSRYALGWIQHANGWLSHTGSNTYNFANIWISPASNWACVVYLNYGGTQAFEISDAVVVHLIQQYSI